MPVRDAARVATLAFAVALALPGCVGGQDDVRAEDAERPVSADAGRDAAPDRSASPDAAGDPPTTGTPPLPRVLPADEAARDPSLFAFRARLERAIAGRDTAALLAALDPDIKLSFGGDGGLADFRRRWLGGDSRGGPDDDADIWAELGAVLSLGGRFHADSVFYAPYTFQPFPPGEEPADYDPFGALIAIDDAAPVFAAPELGADTLAELSFHLVRHEWRASEADPPPGWTAVRLADDALGFVRSDAVRSPIDYRAIFTRRDGRWQMTVLIAGD